MVNFDEVAGGPTKPDRPVPQWVVDAAWLARLARGSSWPGEMAERVEVAADRVIDAAANWGRWVR